MAVGWTLLLALAVTGAVAVGRRLHRYPGGMGFAFGGEHSAARHDLDTARNALRALERAAQRELSGAQAAARKAERIHRRRVSSAEADLAYLREPGRGSYLTEIQHLSSTSTSSSRTSPTSGPATFPWTGSPSAATTPRRPRTST